MVEETRDSDWAARGGATEVGQGVGSSRQAAPLEESVEEEAETLIAQFAAAPRRVTVVFDAAMAAAAARSVRAGGTLASFVEAMHEREDAERPVDPARALAMDGYDYTACATAREAEAEIAAWHDLLHGSDG